jgi:valyl-tRNA synthetase
MDTWNTSSITPYILAQLANPEKGSPFESAQTPDFLPMTMRPQAHDIIRTWAFYTIVKSWMHNKIIPWQEIVISGHVLSDSREKVSKSKGGGKLAPEALLTQYPADVIRYWTASGSLGYDVAFSENQLKIGNRLVTKLWNAFRFVGEHKPESVEQPKDLGIVNQWMLHQATLYFNKYQAHFENYEFGSALMAIEPFFWNDFCDNYLELIKNQLFNPQEYDAKLVAATKWTLNHVGLRILQLYAPYLPHITETIYLDLYQPKLGTASIHQTRFADVQTKFDFAESARITDNIITITSLARKLKTEKQLSLKAPLATLKIHGTDQGMLDRIKEQEQIIRGITHAQIIEYIAQPIDAPTMTGIDDQWHAQVGI